MAQISSKCMKNRVEITRWLLGVTGCRWRLLHIINHVCTTEPCHNAHVLPQ